VGLDLSKFELKSKNGVGVSRPSLYDCIAVVNHMGGMGGGHYTAYANHQISQFGGYGAKELQDKGGKWMLFDDSYVDFVEDPERRVVSKAAYVLVFQRRTTV
jgi:ubiquitin carboxyl-terminal hydrolase 4/11/15